MPLVLQEAVEADVDRICEIERLAYATNRLSPFLFPGPMPPDAQEKRGERLVIQLREEPGIRWMKVVDSDSGEMAAFAKWDIVEKPKISAFTRWFGEGCNVEACEEFFGGIHKKRNELMADKPHCCKFSLAHDSSVGLTSDRSSARSPPHGPKVSATGSWSHVDSVGAENCR